VFTPTPDAIAAALALPVNPEPADMAAAWTGLTGEAICPGCTYLVRLQKFNRLRRHYQAAAGISPESRPVSKYQFKPEHRASRRSRGTRVNLTLGADHDIAVTVTSENLTDELAEAMIAAGHCHILEPADEVATETQEDGGKLPAIGQANKPELQAIYTQELGQEPGDLTVAELRAAIKSHREATAQAGAEAGA
jgi:hypothetical protein